MTHSVIAVLAHVDSGKTTLSEAILYKSGAIRKLGRVDHKDAFLDNDPIEREPYSQSRLSLSGEIPRSRCLTHRVTLTFRGRPSAPSLS